MATDWSAIHEQRLALAEDLAGLSAEQWNEPSLCAGWSVHQALAHLTATAGLTPPSFIARFARAGFSLARYNTRNVAIESAAGPAGTLAEFRARSSRTSSPPGPGDTWLGEIIVHAEDIRRPLGIAHEYPIDSLTRLIRFYASSNLVIDGKRRASAVTLKATDTQFELGSGPLVEGPTLSLLLVTTGRNAALADLSGPGVDVLRAL